MEAFPTFPQPFSALYYSIWPIACRTFSDYSAAYLPVDCRLVVCCKDVFKSHYINSPVHSVIHASPVREKLLCFSDSNFDFFWLGVPRFRTVPCAPSWGPSSSAVPTCPDDATRMQVGSGGSETPPASPSRICTRSGEAPSRCFFRQSGLVLTSVVRSRALEEAAGRIEPAFAIFRSTNLVGNGAHDAMRTRDAAFTRQG